MKTILTIITLIQCMTSTVRANEMAVDEKNNSIKIVNAVSPAVLGSDKTFTGKVHITTVLSAQDSESISCASVAFEAGARSAWHTHPKGQLLVVTKGSGLIQAEDQPVRRIQVGDSIWTPPNVKHWHGASPISAMVHTATQEIVNGTPVKWMEKVTDEQYKQRPQ